MAAVQEELWPAVEAERPLSERVASGFLGAVLVIFSILGYLALPGWMQVVFDPRLFLFGLMIVVCVPVLIFSSAFKFVRSRSQKADRETDR